jgi:hypothetical protein
MLQTVLLFGRQTFKFYFTLLLLKPKMGVKTWDFPAVSENV